MKRETSEMATVRNVDDLRSFLFSSTSLKALQDGLEINGNWTASTIVGWLQEEIQSSTDGSYRKRCTKCLNALVKKYRIFPSSFFCDNVRRDGDYPLGGGGFADIYKGVADNRSVSLKVLRVHTQPDEKKRKKMVEDFYREALIWTQLSHPNVLQLLGVNTTLFKTDFCLVSPWMVNSDIITFLERRPDHDRLRSIRDIAAGLDYLHSRSPMIVHGDIKGANILVDEDCNCRLADFGLSREAHGTTMVETSTGGIKGSLRWMALEMFQPSTTRDSNEDRSPRDIYAYACTIVEIMTGKPPFPDLLDVAVITQVLLNRARPERPTGVWCPDNVWELVEGCWDQEWPKRPTATYVHHYLTGLTKTDISLGADSSSALASHLETPIQIMLPALEQTSYGGVVTFNPPHAQSIHDDPSPDGYTDGNFSQNNAHSKLESRARSKSFTSYLTKLVPSTTSSSPPRNNGASHLEQSSSPEIALVTPSPDRRPGLRSGAKSIHNYFTNLVPASRQRYSTPVAIAKSFDDPFENVLKPPPHETPKQAAERVAREAEAKRVSDAIDAELKKEKKKAREERKGVKGLLLVGQAGSGKLSGGLNSSLFRCLTLPGKTTVLKNLVARYDSATWDKERSIWYTVIQLNIMSLLLDIIELIYKDLQVQSKEDYDEDRLTTSGFTSRHGFLIEPLEPLRRLITVSTLRRALEKHVRSNHIRFSRLGVSTPVSHPGPRDVSVERYIIDNAFNVIVANKDSVKALWADESVQNALKRRTIRHLGSTEFYFEHLDRVASSDYYPTDEDIAYAYLPTSGYQDIKLTINSESVLQIANIGGSRGQRSVLAQALMEGEYNTIIFLCPISAFDEVLEEDHAINRLEDSILLWRAICSNKLVSARRFILFLNKCDLLEQKLKSGVSIKKYIPSYADRPNESSEFVNYVSRHMRSIYKHFSPLERNRTLHVFTTTATDIEALERTLKDTIPV
ncbi:hypothetical protein E1B28_011696 [Marasmius oreades]|uniref:Protein kinase domain-containing protein n=1 Tax=Marasmius oreades TaxID=181124 RepID=A0A9P7USD1_9AGAR|nr:uncharacterized protein E1B28_011696 [Marasmius oreades]KAG7090079.1 hypothetical protein E1B28_011696 [Marasmius oreades]